ncbi:MAG: sigma-70 family RNA polymerase sigma factor [bacterium]|nr:sigma-70 family RNA polymerase sigma factor [bacterium]
MKITEHNLIEEMKLHNEDALVYFIDHYGWIVKTILYKKLSSHPMELEECMNDVFLNIWNHIGQFDPSKAKLETWIAAVTKYRAIDYLRKVANTPVHNDIEELDIEDKREVFETVYEEENQIAFNGLLSCLKEEDKQMFYKLYYEDKSSDQVSEELGMKKSVLYNRIMRGKKRLRRALEGGSIS